jgi:hypothetical protein
LLPAPSFLAFDAEHFLGEFGSGHGRSPSLRAGLRDCRPQSWHGNQGAIAVP